ncbi:hypothetical protein CK203_076616 [Vitis vinifera]|uniref:DUF4283 domain-containing protein n=1 Tax=Vitis vinifera TaxID=29760 RepID=A0A438EYM1_VITVI|nr:hypothetical protein CK203_076616 [Vitis vinifera]
MNRVKVNEIWYIEEREIKEEVCRVFQGLMVDPGGWKPNIDVLNLERLEEGDVEGWRSHSRRRSGDGEDGVLGKDGAEVENVEELADEFGYKVRKLPSTYLGMPLGAPFKMCCKRGME